MGLSPITGLPRTPGEKWDFLVQSAGTVYAIEVKAEENLRAKSLRSFKEKYSEVQARRFSLSDYREQNWLTNVPLYLMGNTGLWL